MKSHSKIFLFSLLVLCMFSCNQNNQEEGGDDDNTIASIQGKCFLQPINKNYALSFAILKTKVIINFLDTSYCNIEITSSAGDVTLSRRYKIDVDQLKLIDPITDNIKIYYIRSYNIAAQTFCLASENNVRLFNAIPYEDAKSVIYSENTLKRDEFLYPPLTPKQREFGTDQVVEENGRLKIVEDPDKKLVSDLNVYQLF